MAAVMLLLCLGCTMDLFGVEARVPDPDRVERLEVSLDLGAPGDSGGHYSAVLTEPENIQKFIDLHLSYSPALLISKDKLVLRCARHLRPLGSNILPPEKAIAFLSTDN